MNEIHPSRFHSRFVKESETAPRVSRRSFCVALGSAIAGLSCGIGGTEPPDNATATPELSARPAAPTQVTTPGFYQLWGESPRCHLLVPNSYRADTPLPLVVALHGAGSTSEGQYSLLASYAHDRGFLLLLPESQFQTWDGIQGLYATDLHTIDAGLTKTFERCAVDFNRVSLEGFSDGASYALGVGITNPQVFTRVVAFSPGFVTPASPKAAKPRVFISHGWRDPVLPIDGSSRIIVPELIEAGFSVDYHEFDGVHQITAPILAAALDFMLLP